MKIETMSAAHLFLQLQGALPVDVEQHVAAFRHRRFGRLARRGVEIAMHLGPFQQRVGIAQRSNSRSETK